MADFSSENLREGLIVGIGNPLLDIIANADLQLLNKYNLKENHASLAEEKHLPLYHELLEKHHPKFVAGGSVQNTLRVFQWLIQKPHVSVFMGAVGTDEYGKILQEKAEEDGVLVKYQYHKDYPTGTCAVIITSEHRTLCANLAAATHFHIDHIRTQENRRVLERAELFYISGFFLTVSPETAMESAQLACQQNKLLVCNLSAPFICEMCCEVQGSLMPFMDMVFGNETEAVTFATAQKLGSTDLREIAAKMVAMPKENKNRARIVVITQGSLPVIVATKSEVMEIPVPTIANAAIVDTNGAGDAFVGGFLSQLLQGKSLERCVDCGNWAAGQIIQRSGCTFDSNVQYHV